MPGELPTKKQLEKRSYGMQVLLDEIMVKSGMSDEDWEAYRAKGDVFNNTVLINVYGHTPEDVIRIGSEMQAAQVEILRKYVIAGELTPEALERRGEEVYQMLESEDFDFSDLVADLKSSLVFKELEKTLGKGGAEKALGDTMEYGLDKLGKASGLKDLKPEDFDVPEEEPEEGSE